MISLKGVSVRVIILFLLMLALSILVSLFIIINRGQMERLAMERLIAEKSSEINEVVSKLFYRTEILSSFVIQNEGDISRFEQMALIIVDDPAILNVLVAPDGVVSNAFSHDNDVSGLIGFDFFENRDGNNEALIAVETKKLVMAGPFFGAQGRWIMAGRLPVFLNSGAGEIFWGMVSVTLKFPEALDGARLNDLTERGFAYEIWRYNPDTGDKQIIADSGNDIGGKAGYIENKINIANAEWYFRIISYKTWIHYPETWISLTISLLVSLLIAIIAHSYEELKKVNTKANEQHQTILSNLKYASHIQRSILPSNDLFKDIFSDYFAIWDPRDIVGGDIYWAKHFDKGCLLCVCDCTGHGTPGALLTMLVVSALEASADPDTCDDPAEIIWRLEQRFSDVFNTKSNGYKLDKIKDGCDLAVLFIANDGSVSMSSGNSNLFVCDGKNVKRIKGQKIYIGEGKLKDKNDIETIHIPANPKNKFYVASDGLFDQIGQNSGVPFGYNRFKQIILEKHLESIAVISDTLWREFENYRGDEPRRDDLQLICFRV